MIKDLIALESTSKVWIYQADRFLTYDELDTIRPLIFNFLDEWTSHNQSLITYGNVFHRRFIGLFVDESLAGVSGCSIDSSVRFIASLGQMIGVDFFERTTFCYIQDDEVMDIGSKDVTNAYNTGIINDNTLFFDHLLADKDQFLKRWLVPLRESWHNKFIKK